MSPTSIFSSFEGFIIFLGFSLTSLTLLTFDLTSIISCNLISFRFFNSFSSSNISSISANLYSISSLYLASTFLRTFSLSFSNCSILDSYSDFSFSYSSICLFNKVRSSESFKYSCSNFWIKCLSSVSEFYINSSAFLIICSFNPSLLAILNALLEPLIPRTNR